MEKEPAPLATSHKRPLKPDLKEIVTDFVKEQKYYLGLELEEEEKNTIEKVSNYSAKQLEIIGICIRKLEIVETVYSSYGKYLVEFKRKTTDDYQTKLSKYKFDNGDVVGLYQYSDKINTTPISRGIMSQFNSNKIVVAFESELDEENLPSNICLVQLSNKITYDKIIMAMNKLEQGGWNDKINPLVNVLFGVFEPTYNDSEETKEYNKKLNFFNEGLNESQQEAVKFALTVNEVGLIHGPPGTGKTTTVVEIILQLLKLGKNILVVAPSNIAVDNIAEKLIYFKNNTSQIEFDLCRIGHPVRLLNSVIEISVDQKVENSSNTKFVKDVKRDIEKIKRDLSKLSFKEKEKKFELKGQLKTLRDEIKGNYKNTVMDIYRKTNVVLSTCVGSGDNYLYNAITEKNPFDYVIIDECAQATECLCWISILQGKKLILAGDHLQLPPTIKSKDSEYVLGYTLFDKMMEYYGEKCSRLLKVQYRMNEKIMKFSSDELYNGLLIADDSVKNHTVNDLLEEYKIKEELNDEWEIKDKSLIMINTSNCDFYESLDEETLSKYNNGEIEICKKVVDYLLNILKVNKGDIGIITPYSSQVNFLNENILFNEEFSEGNDVLEISTVDGFQGREKEIIILSMVRSNQKNDIGFLRDKRRMNVAITRPRRMLIVIGDFETIKVDPFLKNMGEYMEKNAFTVEPIGQIFTYEEYEDIKSTYDQIKKRQIKAKKEEEKEEIAAENKKKKAKANKRKKKK